MAKRSRSFALRVLVGIAVASCLTGFAVWRALTPKIHTATMAELLAVIPLELREPEVEDRAAIERFEALQKLSQKIDLKSIGALFVKKNSAAVRFAAAKHFVESGKQSIPQLEAIIVAGSLQMPGKEIDFEPLTQLKGIVKALGASGVLYANRHDFKTSVRLLALSAKISDRMTKGDGTLIKYLVGIANQSIAVHSIEEALLMSDFPVEGCRRLLEVMHAAPENDEVLRLAFRTEFQRYSLKYLPDPTQYIANLMSGDPDAEVSRANIFSSIGTYEAIETTKEMSTLVQTCMRNALRPYAQYDHSADLHIDKVTKDLPQVPSSGGDDNLKGEWGKFRFRLTMNTTHNSLGRMLLSISLSGGAEVIASDRSRANWDTCRVLLASKIYRRAHQNQLPPDTSSFAPILGAWPKDPFTGGPMIYNFNAEKAYSVGQDLRDDGGDASFILSKSKDIGVSLR